MASIYLIRHGQASFGAADYDALSPLGFEQARALGVALRPRLPQGAPLQAWAGGMRRHRETAQACIEALDLHPELQADPGFDEFDHEQVIDCCEPRYRDRALMQAELRAQADPRAAFQAMFERAVARWTGGQHDAEYRESWPAFLARCEAALARVAATLPRDGVALVFTSGGVISAICRGLMGLDTAATLRLNWTLVNAGVSRIAIGRTGPRLASLNEHAHFEGQHSSLLSYR